MKPRKRSSRKSAAKEKRGKFSLWLSKLSLIYFGLLSLVYSFIVIFPFRNLSQSFASILLSSAMAVINFLIFGYSFRLKDSKARKLVFSGSLMVMLGFVFYWILNVYRNSPIISWIGILVDVFMLAGYLCLLSGIKKVVKPR